MYRYVPAIHIKLIYCTGILLPSYPDNAYPEVVGFFFKVNRSNVIFSTYPTSERSPSSTPVVSSNYF